MTATIRDRFRSFPLTTAVVVQSIALMIVVVSFIAYAWVQSTRQSDSDAVVNCRGKSGATLTAAQATNQLALDNLVIALGDPAKRDEVPPYGPEIGALSDTAHALQSAADARTAFEKNPTGDC